MLVESLKKNEKLKRINFESNTFTYDSESRAKVDDLIIEAKKINPNLAIQIEKEDDWKEELEKKLKT